MSATTPPNAAGGTLAFVDLAAQAATLITLRLDEMSSKDVFLYEFGIDGMFNIAAPRRTNLDTQTLATLEPAQDAHRSPRARDPQIVQACGRAAAQPRLDRRQSATPFTATFRRAQAGP